MRGINVLMGEIMKKKILLITVTISMSLTGCSSSASAQTSLTPIESQTAEASINMTSDDGVISYAKYELTEHDGEKGIRVYFSYTHKSDEDSYPDSAFTVEAFQDKTKLDWAYTWDSHDSEGNMQKLVSTNSTVEVAKQFKLVDVTTPVTLRVLESPGFNDSPKQEITINIVE